MVKIRKHSDIEKVPLQYQSHIINLFNQIAFAYKEDSTKLDLDSMGAIFFVSSAKDFEKYQDFGLSSPIDERRFEEITVENGIATGIIVLSNSKAITIVGSLPAFINYLEEV